jgi:hypothetical protein
LAIVEVLREVALPDAVTSPIEIVEAIEIVWLPILVQVVPLADL